MIATLVEYAKLFALLVAVAVASGLVVMSVAMRTGGATVETPDLRGKRIIAAIEILDGRGLNLKVTRLAWDPEIPADSVVSQAPGPGEPVKTGRDVDVVISRGPRETVVPDLTGSTELRAEAILSRNSLATGARARAPCASGRQGVILAQRPGPHTRIGRGETVSLLVCDGPFPSYLAAPQFTGVSLAAAMERTKRAGLKINRVTYRPDAAPRETVIEQTPAPGARAAQGALVTLAVSEGPSAGGDASATYAFLYYTVPSLPGPVKVSVLLENSDGEKEIYNRVHRPGDAVSLLAPVKGRTAAKIFLDGELAEVKRY
ncbi:MAG: PASTA domain-containing protein [Nitrospinae bacterium]|nr:PASTA domain-containing protein [Nitrospinota bacterium]